jgi:hypothetical protein
MKPYLGILMDSFWEAVGSKVLWALLICWTILLAGLAPFGYITERSFELSSLDIRNRTGLGQKLARGLEKQGTPAQQAVALRLDDAFKKKLEQSGKNSDPEQRYRLGGREYARELNRLLHQPDLYSEDAFPSAGQRKRLQPILEKPLAQRSREEVEELNRELLQIAFSADLATPRSEQLWIGYAGFKLTDPLPITRQKANDFVQDYALTLIIRLGLSIVVVFVGIIVTSAMIPETFRSGALHLLLSKPISRPLLYLSKFLGGTLFVLANIAYFLTGLYLLVGIRLELWNIGLLVCIPLLLFVFMIFYSVSALVGLIWNNAIISVVACILFWVFCTSLGVVRNVIRPQAELVPQVVRFMEHQGHTLAVTQGGVLSVWNEKHAVWQPAVDSDSNPSGRVLGPLRDPEGKRLLLRSDFRDPFGGFRTRSRAFAILDVNEDADEPPTPAAPRRESESNDTASGQPATVTGVAARAVVESRVDSGELGSSAAEARRKPRWMAESGPEPPMLLLDLLAFEDYGLAVTRNGIFRLDWEVINATQTARGGGIFDFLRGAVSRLQPFVEVTPTGYEFSDFVAVAADPAARQLLIFNGGTVDLLGLEESGSRPEASGRFVVQHSTKLEGEGQVPALVAMTPGACAVTREGLGVTVLSRDLQEVRHSAKLPDASEVRQMQPIPGTESFSVVTHAGNWFSLDAASGTWTRLDRRWARSVSGVSWLDSERVWVGIQPNRAALWNSATDKIERQLVPQASTMEFMYGWIIDPLYKVNPKPAALNDAMSYLLSGKTTDDVQVIKTDLEGATLERDIWQPIISNLIFVLAMLAAGCIWVSRKQF